MSVDLQEAFEKDFAGYPLHKAPSGQYALDSVHDLFMAYRMGSKYHAALQTRDQWRPIASAPKKKNKILLGYANGKIFPIQWGGFLENGKVVPCWADEAHELDVYPTHWMPLPESPPTEVDENGK